MPEVNTQSVDVPYTSSYTAAASNVSGVRPFAGQVVFRRRYRVLQFLIESLALVAAWLLTFELRLALNGVLEQALSRQQLALAAPPVSAILALWILVSAYRGTFRSRAVPSAASGLREAAESALIAAALTIVVTFFSRQMGVNLSRSFVLLFAPLSFLCLAGARYAGLLAAVVCDRKWPAPERVAVVGCGQAARDAVDRLRQAGASAVSVAGVVLPREATAEGLGNPVPVLGRTAELGALINRHGLDRLVILDGHLGESEMEDCAAVSKRMGVIAGRAFGLVKSDARLEMTEHYGLHLLELRPVAFTRGQEAAKRALDVVVSASLLLLLGPLLGLLAMLVKCSSPGGVLYRATRVGRGGRHFTFLKFRSMYTTGEDRSELAARNQHAGHLFKIRNDPRVTPFGRFLRRSSLDELPQLLNVLLGEMSLVGPRPLPAEDLDADGQSRQFAAWAQQRSLVPPGISGLWQINGRSELPFEAMIELDMRYVQNRCFALDLRILLETPLVVLRGRGAY